MAVAFNATSAAQTFGPTRSFSFSFAASGSDRAAFVVISWMSWSVAGAVLTLTYGGTPMTFIGSTFVTVAGVDRLVGVWKLVNPPTGSQTVQVTTDDKDIWGVMGAISFTGVDQTTPNGSFTGSTGASTTPSATEPATTSGNMVLGGLVVADGSYTISPGSGRTLAYSGQERAGVGNSGGAEYVAASGSSMVMDWTLSTSKDWAAFAMEILAAVVAPVNTVAPSCSPSSGTTADNFAFSSGSWDNTPTSWAWEHRAQGSSGAWTQFSTSQNPTVAGSTFGAGVWDTRLTATNAGGSSTPANGTQITVTVPVPVNSVAPAVTPTAGVVGDMFSCTTGTWTNTPTSYAYQWKLNGSNIGGATSSTYVAISAGSLTCAVTASNAGGPGTPATSNAATVTLPAGDRSRLLLLGAT